VDEVHHAFGGRYYSDLFASLDPAVVAGFTALLPSSKRVKLDPRVRGAVGEPHILSYDFARLKEIDPGFEPPKAIADIFDAEMDDQEDQAYNALYRREVRGDPITVKRLERDLAVFGRRVCCKSYEDAVGKGRVSRHRDLEDLCASDTPSHKARGLVEVLRAYDAAGSAELGPAIVFTSRRAAAYELRDVIVGEIGLPGDRVAVLTGDMSGNERAELVKRARGGGVDVIVSTIVGEEGVDIPAAGLLVMADIPKSPLRFYQRLGRLIRASSNRGGAVKYLAMLLTPKTGEYLDLGAAVWNLYAEGVDIGYVVYNINGEKGPGARAADLVAKLAGGKPVPYAALIPGVPDGRGLLELVADILRTLTHPVLYGVLEGIAGYKGGGTSKVNDILSSLNRIVDSSSLSRDLSSAIVQGLVSYIYDVDLLSEVIVAGIRRLYQKCKASNKRICEDKFFSLSNKSFLRAISLVFPKATEEAVVRELEERARSREQLLAEVKERGLIRDYRVRVYSKEYNEKNRAFPLELEVAVDMGDLLVKLPIQISYYDVSRDFRDSGGAMGLFGVNALTAGYEAIWKFLEHTVGGLDLADGPGA